MSFNFKHKTLDNFKIVFFLSGVKTTLPSIETTMGGKKLLFGVTFLLLSQLIQHSNAVCKYILLYGS